jgi:hypothetical protein
MFCICSTFNLSCFAASIFSNTFSTTVLVKLNGADYIIIDGSNNGTTSKYLTINKLYDTINENTNEYYIIDDGPIKWWYDKELFKPLSEIRNEKINKLLEDES